MSIPQGEVDAVTMFAVEILWHSPFRFHDRPSVNQAPSERRGAPEESNARNGRVYSFGAAQVKLAVSLCSPFPEKSATAG